MRTLVAALFLFPALAQAGFEGSISFTPQEKARHEAGIDVITKEAAACAEADFAYHTAFYQEHGISPFYGENSDFAKKSESSRRRFLRRHDVDEELVGQLQSMSCVGYVMKCLNKGFTAAGQQDLWLRIKKYTQDNGVSGLALQDALQKLGWKVLFWLPDERRNEVRRIYEEREDRHNTYRFWGYHAERLAQVRNHKMYLDNHVDDGTTLVNFGPHTPAFLMGVPFFVGTAHGGYHVFQGAKGYVLEEHAMVEITDPKSVDKSLFNPMESGGPTEGMLFSGLIAVPAKYLK